jgi:hypothetical protein
MNPSPQPVRKRVSKEAEVENSPKVHTCVDSDDQQDFEHFVQPELCQGECFGKA